MPNSTVTCSLYQTSKVEFTYAESRAYRVDFRRISTSQDSSSRMPVLNLQPDNEIRWFSEPGDHGSRINPVLLECLTDKGLLTARFGSEPLGEALQHRPDVSRGKFEYARLKPAQLPVDLPVPTDGDLWARRSEFHVGDTSLLVTEIFLPGVMDCTTPDAQAAEKN